MRPLDVRHLALPALGFFVLLGLAFTVTGRSAARPEAGLYQAARAYLSDLARGDVERVATWHRGALERSDLLAITQRRGWLAQIAYVRTSATGREGEVGVHWFDDRGRPRGRVRHLWARSDRSGWLVERTTRLDAATPGRTDAGTRSRRFQG